MMHVVKQLAIAALVLVTACAGVIVINQTAQLVGLANTISPAFGQAVLYGLLAIYVSAVIVPVILLMRLPRSLRPPGDESSPEYSLYLDQVRARLCANPRLCLTIDQLATRDDVDAALRTLDAHAFSIIKKTASTVFVSTAISQNGRLDALMVLAAETRMIWLLAHVYAQRPTLRDMARLYANVAVSVFAAAELDELDISEQIEPVIAAAVGNSIVSVVPGMAAFTAIVMQSLLDGTANAYLTLRIGVICQRYCACITSADTKQVRRQASLVAAQMLGSIVAESASTVTKAMFAAGKKAGQSAMQSAASSIVNAGAKLNPFRGPERD